MTNIGDPTAITNAQVRAVYDVLGLDQTTTTAVPSIPDGWVLLNGITVVWLRGRSRWTASTDPRSSPSPGTPKGGVA